MPIRSWLAKAKTLNDLGVTPYNSTDEKPWSDWREASVERRWRDLTSRPLPVSDASKPYFGCRLHDSEVMAVERSPKELRLQLDNVNAQDFAHYLEATLDLSPQEAIWPVDLVLCDPSYVRAARVDLRGGLRFVDSERLAGTEFLYDWFFEQDGRLQWIANLWKFDPHGTFDSQNIYLMVDCAAAKAVDRCAEVFAHLYGEAAADLYRDAVAGIDDRPIDFDVYDSQRETPDFIRRRISARGLTRADFRPSTV